MSLGNKQKVANAKVVMQNLQDEWDDAMNEKGSELVEMTRVCTYSRLINIEIINDAIHDFYYQLQKDKKLYRQALKQNANRMIEGFIKYTHVIHIRAGQEAIDEIDEIKDNFMPAIKDTLQKLRINIKQDLDNAKYSNSLLMSYAILAEQLCEICERSFAKDVDDFIRKIPKFGKYIDINALKIDGSIKWLKEVLNVLYAKTKPKDAKGNLWASDNTQKLVNILIKQLRNSDATVQAVKMFHNKD